MANRKISEFTALTAPAATDVLPIIDQSESGADKNKKITFEDLLSNAPAGSETAPSFSFTGDNDTGLSQSGSNGLLLATGGVARLTISSAGLVTIPGDLTVSGTTTTIDSTTLTVKDKNIEIAKGNGNDAAVDGAGITIDSTDGDKTWNWVDSTDAWTSSEHIDLASGKVIKVAGTQILSATQYTGNAATATTATTVTNLTVAAESTDTSCSVLFATAPSGSLPAKTATTLTFNSNTGALTATTFVGALTGNVTGNASGSSGSCTGNAATATALATARAINGVDFDGTAAITVTAAAGTLTGTELKSTVVTSSLTSVGTLTSLASGAITTTDNLSVDNAKEVRLYEADSNGSAYVGIKGATDKGSDASYTVSLPSAAPTANQVLKANASTPTNLEWATDTSTDSSKLPLAGGTLTGDLLIDNQKDLRFGEADSNGSNYVAFQAPASIGSDVTWTLPDADGSAGQFLKTDGSGTLSWATDATTDSSKMPLAGGTFTGSVIHNYTDAIKVPVGTTGQRPTGAAGHFRYNSTTGKFEGYTDEWGEIAGGGGGESGLIQMAQTLSTSTTLTTNYNAFSVQPTVASGVTITVPSGAVWAII